MSATKGRKVPAWLKGKPARIAIILLLALAAWLLWKQFFPELDLQDLLDRFAQFLGPWTYLIVAVLAFLETGAFVGLLVPGETTLLIGGAVAGLGQINLYLLIAIAWISALLSAACPLTAAEFMASLMAARLEEVTPVTVVSA